MNLRTIERHVMGVGGRESLPSLEKPLKDLVTEAQNGSQDSLAGLCDLLTTLLTRQFRRKLADSLWPPIFFDHDDLAQNALILITSHLPNFDPSRGKGTTFDQNFYAWVNRIAKSAYFKAMSRERPTNRISLQDWHEPDCPQEDQETEEPRPEYNRATLDKVILEVVPEKYKEIAREKMSGLSNAQVAKRHSMSVGHLESRVMPIIKKAVETQVLEGAGYKPPRCYPKDIASRISGGQIESVMIFGNRYSTDEAVGRYVNTRKKIGDSKLLNNGYVLLSEAATEKECKTIRGNSYYDGSLVRTGQRVYIRKDDLEEIRIRRLGKGL